MTQDVPVLNDLPETPDPDNRSTFNALAYGWSSALGPWGRKLVLVAQTAKINADQANVSAADAQAAAVAAVAAANYEGNYSASRTYQVGRSASYASKIWIANTINTAITPVEGLNWTELKVSRPPFEDLNVLAQVQASALCF